MALDWKSRAKPFAVLLADAAVVRSPKLIDKLRPDAVELRLDLVRKVPEHEIEAFLRRTRRRAISVLLTARRGRDGGKWRLGHEESRLAALLRYASLVDAVDIESDLSPRRLSEILKASRGRAIIFSHHNMKATPSFEMIAELYKKAIALGADRFKIAVRAKTSLDAEDLARVAFLLSHGPIPVTAIAMGGWGRWTRWVLPKMIGGPSYASESGLAAPGQIPFAELKELLAKS